MELNNIIEKVAIETNLPKEIVDNTYKAYWTFIRNYIESLPMKEEIGQEDYTKLRTSINIPSIGKLNCIYSRYLGIKERFKIISKIRNNGH